MKIIWCMVPEIWSATDRIFIHFGTFFALLPLTTQKIKILKKWKKVHVDIIILQKCTKNHDHMLYCSWDTACDTCNCYFSFWAIFCTFTPLTVWKTKIKKKKKKNPKILSFHTCVNKIMIKWCMVPEIRWARVRPMKRWTDGWKKWYIEVGASPKNIMQLHCGGNLNVFNETKVAPIAETLENTDNTT